ncbi:MAG: hypothetical protein HS101_01000 [Planctomycetia bacterium]|nr:hypothetical protein [Planctomycetia bacterium]MCC7313817.1 hypothetical protein [Planctomycetota bacterium]
MNRFTWTLSLTICFGAFAAQTRGQLIDDFTDGGVVLNSTQEVMGYESPSAALGGWRAFSFINNYQSGTLTLDENVGTFRIDSTGLGQVNLGWGWRVTPGGMVAISTNQLNQDWSGYSGIRFHISQSMTRLRLQARLATSVPGSSRSSGSPTFTITTTGASTFDIPFTSFLPTLGDGVVISNVDYVSVTLWNGFVGNTAAFDRIELIPNPEVPGDIDGDGDVDLIDADLFAAVLTDQDVDPMHVARSDLNNDESVDGLDIQPMTAALLDS